MSPIVQFAEAAPPLTVRDIPWSFQGSGVNTISPKWAYQTAIALSRICKDPAMGTMHFGAGHEQGMMGVAEYVALAFDKPVQGHMIHALRDRERTSEHTIFYQSIEPRRKAICVSGRASFVALGGLGTLEEILENIERGVPMVVFGPKKYWSHIKKALQKMPEWDSIKERAHFTSNPVEAADVFLGFAKTSDPENILRHDIPTPEIQDIGQEKVAVMRLKRPLDLFLWANAMCKNRLGLDAEHIVLVDPKGRYARYLKPWLQEAYRRGTISERDLHRTVVVKEGSREAIAWAVANHVRPEAADEGDWRRGCWAALAAAARQAVFEVAGPRGQHPLATAVKAALAA